MGFAFVDKSLFLLGLRVGEAGFLGDFFVCCGLVDVVFVNYGFVLRVY